MYGSTDSSLSLCAGGFQSWLTFALDGAFFEGVFKDLACLVFIFSGNEASLMVPDEKNLFCYIPFITIVIIIIFLLLLLLLYFILL